MSDSNYFRDSSVGPDRYEPMKEPRYTQIATFMRAPSAQSLGEVEATSAATRASPRMPREIERPRLRPCALLKRRASPHHEGWS
jgi:hypothetical protein